MGRVFLPNQSENELAAVLNLRTKRNNGEMNWQGDCGCCFVDRQDSVVARLRLSQLSRDLAEESLKCHRFPNGLRFHVGFFSLAVAQGNFLNERPGLPKSGPY
jgi:hypothetical protein